MLVKERNVLLLCGLLWLPASAALSDPGEIYAAAKTAHLYHETVNRAIDGKCTIDEELLLSAARNGLGALGYTFSSRDNADLLFRVRITIGSVNGSCMANVETSVSTQAKSLQLDYSDRRVGRTRVILDESGGLVLSHGFEFAARLYQFVTESGKSLARKVVAAGGEAGTGGAAPASR
jgi:hypothetical protein